VSFLTRRDFLILTGSIGLGATAAPRSSALWAMNFAAQNADGNKDNSKNALPVNKTASPLMPTIAGDFWTAATKPEVGNHAQPGMQPVDFAIWQAADGTWQIWSCIRKTKLPRGSRVFHRWEGKNLTDTNWKAMGIAMQSEEKYGEKPGSIQAPFVFRHDGKYVMFYGDWVNICKAESKDGKTFQRVIQPNGKTGMFSHGHSRDPMVIKIGDAWHCYYTDNPNQRGIDYCRTSKDLDQWSEPRIVSSGGRGGTKYTAAECPYVVEPKPGHFYLFRTYNYFERPKTLVYYSTDPLNFGHDEDDKNLLAELPVAAPEIFKHQDQYYIACLRPKLDGIRIAKLDWVSIK
jgi:hypothetical protein